MKFKGILAISAILILSGCSLLTNEQQSTECSETISVTQKLLPTVLTCGGNKLIMEKYSIRMHLGETQKLIVSKIPEGFTAEDVSFLSDNPRSVTVSEDGTITAIQSGAASIGVALAGTSVRATVTVMVDSNGG